MLGDRLRYFVAAARHQHLGRAAEELELSQPALSRRISRLEEELGVRLFDRAGRGIRLNAEGQILLRRVDRAFAEIEDARRELQERAQGAKNSIAIGFLVTFGVRLIPDLIRQFRQHNPEVTFRLFEGPTTVLGTLLHDGEVDLCITSPRFANARLEWCRLFDEELFALVPPHHKLAGREEIDLVELADEPFVALRAGHGLRQTMEEICREAGFEPLIAFEGQEVATLRGLVGAGLGVTLAPEREVKAPTQAVSLRVRNPRCFRPVGLVWRKGRYLSGSVVSFREYVIRLFTASDHTSDIKAYTGVPTKP